MTQLLTHSRMQSFKRCRREHLYSYEYGIRRETDPKALRMGSAFHSGIEVLGNGGSVDLAVEVVRKAYERMPDVFDKWEWDIEAETVVRMVCGYAWRWQDAGLEVVATEKSFKLPLLNPETNRPTPVFEWAGKIDGIVRLPDGRLAVKESKLLGDDISEDADLRRRMQFDPQISGYVNAARAMGYPVDTVLYDCARKPTIKPEQVPILDRLGAKIVLDQYGTRVKTAKKEWRQTGDKEKGFVLQQRIQTPEEWGEKLNNDIAERPDFYFQRWEVARMDADLEEYRQEVWETQQSIREAQKTGRWYRTVSAHTCDFCSYFQFCANKGLDPKGILPEGFVRVTNIHQELGELNYVNGHCTATEESTAPSTEQVTAEG